MDHYQMYILPAIGIVIPLIFSGPWFFLFWRYHRRAAAAANRQPIQFGLRAVLLWAIPVVALATWIAGWEGEFFTNRRVLSHKAAALILLFNACGFVLFVHSLRAMIRRQRIDNHQAPPRAES
jgi:hypothetical protein